jgi:hypothetical protein
MEGDERSHPLVLEYRQAARPFETRAQRVFQRCFVALALVFGLLCIFDGSAVTGMAFVGIGSFFAMVMFFPIHREP